MKKIVVLLLTIMILCSVASADEITFRGIPWDSSAEEVKTALIAGTSSITRCEVNESSMAFRNAFQYSGPGDIPYSTLIASYTNKKCGYLVEPISSIEVAGYTVESIWCFAHYGTKNNKVSKDIVDSKFYAAQYRFRVDNVLSAYTDLQGKLRYLYGECTTVERDEGDDDVYVSTWQGDHNTAVTLYCRKSLYGGIIYIRYYKTDRDETLSQINEIVEQTYYANSDLTGL